MVRFPPPIGDGQPVTCGGVVIKLQTDRMETLKISVLAESGCVSG